MAENRKGKRLNKQDFDFIKTLQNHGLGQTEIMRITKRGAGTVHTATKSETFAQYVKIRKADNLKQKQMPETIQLLTEPTPKVNTPTITRQPDYATVEDVQKVYKAVIELTAVINQLLEAQTKPPVVKKGIFNR